MGDYGLASLPVVTQNRLSGRVTLLASYRIPEARRQSARVKEIMSPQHQGHQLLERVGALPSGGAQLNDRGQTFFGCSLTDGRVVLLLATPGSSARPMSYVN